MSRFLLHALAFTLLVVPGAVDAADVSGSLLYDDQPVSEVFPDITTAVVHGDPWEPGDQIVGTVDLATSTYSISGLAAGLYGLSVVDNATGDPTFIAIAPQAPAGG